MPFLALLARLLPFARIIGVVLGILSALAYVHHTGVVAEQAKQNKIALEEAKKREKIDQKIDGLSCADVHKRLSKFLR